MGKREQLRCKLLHKQPLISSRAIFRVGKDVDGTRARRSLVVCNTDVVRRHIHLSSIVVRFHWSKGGRIGLLDSNQFKPGTALTLYMPSAAQNAAVIPTGDAGYYNSTNNNVSLRQYSCGLPSTAIHRDNLVTRGLPYWPLNAEHACVREE